MSVEEGNISKDITNTETIDVDQNQMDEPNPQLTLELGDIIEILAPENSELHQNTFYIEYIDAILIKMKDISSLKQISLNIDELGNFMDETIKAIHILSRSEEKGYTRQNQLYPNTWIVIHFGGPFPTMIHGKITELEEDQIEITTYPETDILYIDFAYQGIPLSIPIEKIEIRDAPLGIDDQTIAVSEIESQNEYIEHASLESVESEPASIEYTDEGESIIQTPERVKMDENIHDVLHEMYHHIDMVFIGETEEIQQIVEIPENKKRYGIDVQTNDLMDELVSTIPTYQRTTAVLQEIHTLISRFKQLREQFSTFDKYGEIQAAKILGPAYKPLVERLREWNQQLRWMIPTVSLKTKLYDSSIEEVADIVKTDLTEELSQHESIMTEYLDKHSTGDVVKYTETYQKIGKLMMPYAPPENVNCLSMPEIKTDIEGIINNLEDYYGTFWNKTTGLNRRKFIIQRYNLATNKLEKDDAGENNRIEMDRKGKRYIRKPISKPDPICIKSIITLPESVVRYSHINLPMTTIGQRASLSQNPLLLFRLFKKDREIIPEMVDDLEKELVYEDARTDIGSSISFLKNFKEYTLNDEVLADVGAEEAYKKFLNVIIPRTRILIQMIRKYITDKFTVVEVVKSLEPFAVYLKDISYKQHDEIRYFIKERIREFAKELAEKKEAFLILLNMHYKVSPIPNIIKTLLSKDSLDFFETHYRLLESNKTNSELLSNMYSADNTILFNQLVHLDSLLLTTPEELLNNVDTSPEIDDLSETERIKPQDCTRRFLAKRYQTVADLQKDNGEEEVYYDKEFDDTPYSILKNYSEQQKKMPPDLFLQFIAENLVQKHGCPSSQSVSLAETMIKGKKRVKMGEYAILEIRTRLPRETNESNSSTSLNIEPNQEYYRRKNHFWTRDANISEEEFMDNNTLFCNIDNKCLKNPVVKTCDTTKDATERMRDIARLKMREEYSSRIDETFTNRKQELSEHIEKSAEHMLKFRRLQMVETMRHNLKQYSIGKEAFKVESEIISPYESIRDLIFAQLDFAKRQTDIVQFVDQFCRDSVPERESEHWLYCKETNVKLLPRSLFILAEAFMEGKYTERLDEVCRNFGELSDDGDSIVDKYSGYVLRKIEYNEEEGYDETGFKIRSHDIIEKDAATVLIEGLQKKKRVFENKRTELIVGILQYISHKLGISPDDVEGFVLPLATEWLEKNVKSEEKYRVFAEKAKKDGKVIPPYSTYSNQNTIYIVNALVLIAVQTAIPAFTATKMVPGCTKSLSGYPATGIEDTTGIQYLACILHKGKSSVSPWDSISQLTTTKIARGIKDVIEKHLMIRDDIVKKYATKTEYLELFPEIVIPLDHALKKWVHFKPPVVPFQIRNRLHPAAPHLKSELFEHIRHGNMLQHENINIFASKALMHGYGVVEAINAVVSEKEVFLKTSAKVPFLENACCNEAGANPIQYFIEQEDESKTIPKYIDIVSSIEKQLNDIRILSEAPLFYHNTPTNLQFENLPTGKYDINIYSAFIHYCNLDTNVPIPEDLLSMISEKPQQYRIDWNIEEKMEFFKRNGKQFTGANLEELMKIVHNRNIVHPYKSAPLQQIPALKEFLEHLSMQDTPLVETPLYNKISALIDAYHPYQMYSEITTPLSAVKSYLKTSNKRMLSEIMDFMQTHGKQSDRELAKIQDHFEMIVKWKVDKQSSQLDMDGDAGLNHIIQFIKNAVYQMIKGWTSMLLNKIDFQYIPKHWGLAEIHKRDIHHCLTRYYQPFQKFKGDKTITLLLKEIQSKHDLYTFLQLIPTYTPIQKRGATYYSFLDKDTMLSLYQYGYYSTFYEYITLANNSDLLFSDINEKRQSQRRINQEFNGLDYEAAAEEDIGEDVDGDIAEIDIALGNQEDLKTRVSELLAVFIKVNTQDKDITDFAYEDIFMKMRKSRDQEKKSITDFFKNMDADERRMENMKKVLKLGRWNVGMQKGLVDYDEDTYVREREDILTQFGEAATGIFATEEGDPTQEIRDIEQLDAEYRNMMNGEDDAGFNLGMLPEEYGDNYDEMEVEREDDW